MVSHLWINENIQRISTSVRLGKPLYKINTMLMNVTFLKIFRVHKYIINNKKKITNSCYAFSSYIKACKLQTWQYFPTCSFVFSRVPEEIKTLLKKKKKILQAPALFMLEIFDISMYMYCTYIH